MKFLKTALMASAMTLAAGSANAVFIGDHVDITFDPVAAPSFKTQTNGIAVVDPGVEHTEALNATFEADLGATTATFTWFYPGINGTVGSELIWTIADMDLQGGLIGGITGISFNAGASTGAAGEVISSTSTANSIEVRFANFSHTASDPKRIWVFDISHDGVAPPPPPPPPTPDVPVPAALPLMAAGIGALALMARRRKK